MKIEFDVRKRNLYSVTDPSLKSVEIVSSCYASDFKDLAKTVDDVVKSRIGVLRVRKSDSALSSQINEKLTVPLSERLRSLGTYIFQEPQEHGNWYTDFFNIDYFLSSSTIQDFDNALAYYKAKDALEKYPTTKSKRTKVESRDQELLESQLNVAKSKLGTNIANFTAFAAPISAGKKAEYCIVSRVYLEEVLSEITTTKDALLGVLEKYDGYELSFDARDILTQAINLKYYAPSLISNFGEILRMSKSGMDWRVRLLSSKIPNKT